MKFGIYLPNFGPYGNARVLTELAATAEQAGWDGMVPQIKTGSDDDIHDLQEAIRFTSSLREVNEHFDVAYSVSPAHADSRAEQYTEIGVTWFLVQIYPPHFGVDWQGEWPRKAMQDFISAGPPRG